MNQGKKKKWPKKNLGEFIGFLEDNFGDSRGIYIKAIADKLDTTPQNISALFIKDDMKLSKIEKWTNMLGFELTLYFPEKDIVLHPSPFVKPEKYPGAGNLTGLIKYIGDSNISVHYMAQRIGCAPQTINKAFVNGDIFISTLYKMTNNLKINIIWEFNSSLKFRQN